MPSLPLFLFLTLSLLLLLLPLTSPLPTIGVTYSPPNTTTTTTNHSPSPPPPPPPPPPDRIASTITTTLHFPTTRLPNSDPTLIRAFSYTNTSLFLSIPNSLIPAFAANRSNALRWIYAHVLPFYPRSKISLISVGNDVVASSPTFSPFLLPAIRNLHASLHGLGITKIKISTTFSFLDTITTAFPPSNAAFQQPYGDVIVKPLLQFLEDTNSSFLVNIYPYNVYRLNSEIPIGFALFQEHPFNFRDDVVTGVRYRNLFDMMVDAVISAMAVAGHENVPVIVAETGWPSSGGDVNEAEANEIYADMYLRGLVGHLKSGLGTPLRKEGVAETYIYELVDEGGRPPGSRNWGILYPNLTEKYKIEYASSGVRVKFAALMVVFGFLMVLMGS